MTALAANRSETSYVAGGIVLNRDWPRVSDDIDVFHDTDEEIGAAAQKDFETLRSAGFDVTVELHVYGMVEAKVRQDRAETIIQWMSESRRRFFPLVRDLEWGARLHQSDLAVNKVTAASTRTRARDSVDLVSIAQFMCPVGPLILASAGKPPFFSPQRIIDESRRRGLSVPDEEYASVKGLPADWDPLFLREHLAQALDRAEAYVMKAPLEIIGCLAVNFAELPVEVPAGNGEFAFVLRKATEEPEVMPLPKDDAVAEWKGARR